MNTMLNIQDVVNKLPTTLYFQQLPDRQHALSYITYLIQNIPESQNLDTDKLYREVISRELRMVSMKIIEPEILLLVALDKISLADFTLSSNELVRKVIAQNPDKYDLDVMQRVMAQIMTKLPRDLRERVTGKHKLQIYQLLARYLQMDPQLLEKFINYDSAISSTKTHEITMELDNGDYNSLNEQYLKELYNYQKTQPYFSANSLEYGGLAAELSTKASSITESQKVLKAGYIDNKPDLMMGVEDKKIYYFDASSGTMSEMPLESNSTPISVKDLKTVLSAQKINQTDIQKALNNLATPTFTATTIPATTLPATTGLSSIINSFTSTMEYWFGDLLTGKSTNTTLKNTNTTAGITTPLSLEPVPPEFLKKLYNLKKSSGGNINLSQYDNYNDMLGNLSSSNITNTGARTSNISKSVSAIYPGFYQSSQPTRGVDDYTQNEALPIWEVKNPDTTYKAFSGPVPNESISTPSNTPSSTSSSTSSNTPSSTSSITSSSTSSNTPSSTSSNTPSSTSTTAIARFSNLGTNSEMITPEHTVIKKIKNDNKKIENIAIGFITILVLIFLIVIAYYIKSNRI